MAPPPPTPGSPAPPLWTSFVPTLLLSLFFAVAVLWLAPRKGRSVWWVLPALFPCTGVLIVLYLLSLTDKRVLDEIETLKKQIGRQEADGPKA